MSATAAVTLLAAVLAAVISTTGLVFDLWPNLKPDPKERVGAKLESVGRDLNVTRGEYLTRVGRTTPAGEDAEANGNVYYIRAEIQGFKRSALQLRWFTYERISETRQPGLRGSDREEPVFKPQAPINTQIAQVWVETPNDEGKYFIRFELYSGKVLLQFVDTARFTTTELVDR
jgi:hypothetical protein